MKTAKIVAVEDERIVALHLKQQLMKLGYEVAPVAASGESALRNISEFQPDLVLMDIHIEGAFDGIETAARIPAELGIPVIYLTAYSEETTLERARATRPYGYLIKPYSERELYATIEMALERRDVESALKASEDRFRSIFGAISEGIFIIDTTTGAFTDVNEPGCAMFGYTPGELIGLDLQAISSGAASYTQEDATEQIRKAAASEAPRRFDWHCRTKGGEFFWAELSLRLASIGGEKVVLSIVRDLTERRAMEEQLRQAQKMEAVGQLTGGIAHDFNNLLGVIIGNLDLLRDTLPDDPELADLSGDALTAALDGAELTQRLLAFARRQPLQPVQVELRALVESTAKLLSRVLGETITVSLNFEPGVRPVLVDRVQLESAITNLATNARDAMPKGGMLQIATAQRYVDSQYTEGNPDIPIGEYSVIEVTDSGVGMSSEVMSRIFEPFFTTKGREHGTGLGLSMVFGFMKQSGGHVSVYSEVEHGTTFRLYLPSISGQEIASTQVTASALPANQEETILVVEDNAALRNVAVRQLGELGFRVLVAKDATEAIAMCESGPVDLLFSDVVLPGELNGFDLASTATNRWPGMKVLLTSGFPDAKFSENQFEQRFRLLTKPYRKADLARALAEVLNEPGIHGATA